MGKTEGSELHMCHWFGGNGKVWCRACDTHCTLKRIPEHDFRLIVKKGHPAMVGLNLRLTMWYDKAREGFRLKRVEVSGVMFMTMLYARYGPVPYRFDVGQQVPLRIITYVGTLAKRAAEAEGHEPQIMRF